MTCVHIEIIIILFHSVLIKIAIWGMLLCLIFRHNHNPKHCFPGAQFGLGGLIPRLWVYPNSWTVDH